MARTSYWNKSVHAAGRRSVTDATPSDTSAETPSDTPAESPTDTPAPKRSRLRRLVREVSVFMVLAFVLLSARSSLADHYQVPTGSMLPTVHIDDRILVNKAAYGLRVPFTSSFIAEFAGPQIGDTVVLRGRCGDRVSFGEVPGTILPA